MEILVVRQPIFDCRDEIAAYEILYRERAPGGQPTSATLTDATAEQVVLHAALDVGLDQLVGALPAFVSATPVLLAGHAFELLDPARIVVQVSNDDAHRHATRGAIEALHVRGYHLALDGFQGDADDDVLRYFGYARLEVAGPPAAELRSAVAALATRGIRLIARNVPDRSVRDACVAAGIHLFQGYLFSRPETFRAPGLSVTHARTLQLMNMVRDVDQSESRIEDEFRSDVSLTYRLLRIVNSAAVGGCGVRSIGHAIRLLGREPLYRWLGLLLLSLEGDGGVQQEILATALIRARWCELLAEAGTHTLSGGSLFVIGLFSLLDTLLGVPMDRLLARMDLAPEVESALLGRGGLLGQVLRLVEHYEDGDWEGVCRLAAGLGIAERDLGSSYLQAVYWAQEKSEAL